MCAIREKQPEVPARDVPFRSRFGSMHKSFPWSGEVVSAIHDE
jgi:hypothetical protein